MARSEIVNRSSEQDPFEIFENISEGYLYGIDYYHLPINEPFFLPILDFPTRAPKFNGFLKGEESEYKTIPPYFAWELLRGVNVRRLFNTYQKHVSESREVEGLEGYHFGRFLVAKMCYTTRNLPFKVLPWSVGPLIEVVGKDAYSCLKRVLYFGSPVVSLSHALNRPDIKGDSQLVTAMNLKHLIDLQGFGISNDIDFRGTQLIWPINHGFNLTSYQLQFFGEPYKYQVDTEPLEINNKSIDYQIVSLHNIPLGIRKVMLAIGKTWEENFAEFISSRKENNSESSIVDLQRLADILTKAYVSLKNNKEPKFNV